MITTEPTDSKKLTELWKKVAVEVSTRIGEANYQRWFTGAKIVNFRCDVITLLVSTHINKFWIESNYCKLLQDCFIKITKSNIILDIIAEDKVTGIQHNVKNQTTRLISSSDDEIKTTHLPKPEIDFNRVKFRQTELLHGEKQNSESPNSSEQIHNRAFRSSCVARLKKIDKKIVSNLAKKFNPNYRFSNFIPSFECQFAFAAAQAVATHPGLSYNPLFLHGKSGLGKTHLLHAIAQEICIRGELKVCYKTGEEFTNEFIESIKDGSFNKFRRKYRNADVLLIDDIHFIAGKNRSMEEFFHTFNSLVDAKKQIILTSDRAPSEIKSLEKRLVTRFEWGVTAEIPQPDFETRLAILRQKANEWRVCVGDDVMNRLARTVIDSVRSLEGALRRVSSYQILSQKVLNFDKIDRLITDLTKKEKKSVSIKSIQRAVCEKFSLSLEELMSKSRRSRFLIPRQIAMKLCRELASQPLKEIACSFGSNDHAYVIHSCKSLEKKFANDSNIKKEYCELKSQFT